MSPKPAVALALACALITAAPTTRADEPAQGAPTITVEAAPPPPPAQPGPSSPSAPATPKKRGRGQRNAGIATLASGGGLVVLGALVFAFAYPDPHCGSCNFSVYQPAVHDTVTTIGVVMMVVGAASAVTGIVLLSTLPSDPDAGVSLTVGPGSAGLVGRF